MSMNCTLYAAPPALVRRLAAEPEEFVRRLGEQAEGVRSLPLRKTWHGLHFVLTGTAWEGKEPLCFLVSGGRAIATEEEEDEAYSPPRVLSPSAIKKLAKALAAIPAGEFAERFDLGRLAEEGVYPRIWDESPVSLRREYEAAFEEVRRFVSGCAARGEALVVELS